MTDKRATLEGHEAGGGAAGQARAHIRSLAERRGVKPIRDIGDLCGDFWPAEETADDFLLWLRNTRREESVRSIPE
jgi:hypothetical protein